MLTRIRRVRDGNYRFYSLATLFYPDDLMAGREHDYAVTSSPALKGYGPYYL
jgi:hypothetical protein